MTPHKVHFLSILLPTTMSDKQATGVYKDDEKLG